MALSVDIYTILSANSDIVSAVGTRIYPVIAPEKPTLPCIVYTLTGLTPNESKSFANKYDFAYVTVTAIANKLVDAETYGNYVRTAMNRYTGTISSDKIMGVNLQSQSWDYIDDLSYQGASTGIGVFAVSSQWQIQTALNIAE